MFDQNEHIRADVAAADLAKLRSPFAKGASVTAVNTRGLNDGAAALVLMDAAVAQSRGIAPLVRIVASGLGGVAPDVMGELLPNSWTVFRLI